MRAYPGGRLENDDDGREYSCLHREGVTDAEYNMSRGFVAAGANTAAFPQEKPAYIGLPPREYNGFMVYWLPKMQGNAHNHIAFVGDEYGKSAPLSITPPPNSLLRVFMVYRPWRPRCRWRNKRFPHSSARAFALWNGAAARQAWLKRTLCDILHRFVSFGKASWAVFQLRQP